MPWGEEDRKLSDLMMAYWSNFARSGDPNAPGLPAWPRYDTAPAVQYLDVQTRSGPDRYRARYQVLDALPR